MRRKMRISCLYILFNTKLNNTQKRYTYRSSRNRSRSKSRGRGRGSSTASCRHQLWQSGILLLEIKRKVAILCLDIISLKKL